MANRYDRFDSDDRRLLGFLATHAQAVSLPACQNLREFTPDGGNAVSRAQFPIADRELKGKR